MASLGKITSVTGFNFAHSHYRFGEGSEKVGEVSYAACQGIESYIEKFRNSSVMKQNPLYRPKVTLPGNLDSMMADSREAFLHRQRWSSQWP